MENLKPFQTSQLSSLVEKFSPFVKEVKKRIVFTSISFLLATTFGFLFYEEIIKFLINILSLDGINIVFTSPFQFINLAFGCGIATGLIVILPLLIAQILSFLKPALKIKEFGLIIKLVPFSIFLFLVGFIFGIYIMRWQVEIFLDKAFSLGIGNILDISGLLTTVLLTAAMLGIGFQFPVILLLLMRIGIVSQQQITKKRPWVYLGSFIFALFLPPDSILADIFLSLPLIFLFESTLILNKIISRKK